MKLGVSEALAGVLVNLGGSILMSALSRALQSPPSQPETFTELTRPNSRPGKRFVYGMSALAAGTPAPAWVAKDGILYCCHILSSRASDGVSRVWLDKRELEFTGDIHDFTGDGADPDHEKLTGYANFWLGLGDQTGPPDQIMTEMGDPTSTDPELFWPTDRWSGCTVLWGRYDKGDAATRNERWPSGVPEVAALGDWSLVWDPRDEAQDANDPATWTVSSNAWLCILDCLRFNPLARWSLDQIDIASFISAANEADATRALAGGGTQPMWRVGGTVGFAGDVALLDAIRPLVAATGGDLLIDGGGIGAVTASPKTPVMTIADFLADEPFSYRTRLASRDRPKAVQASWPQPEASWEKQTLTPTVVPGETWLGGDDRVEQLDLAMVPFAAQAQHLQNIAARRKALGHSLSFTAGQELLAYGVQAGDWITVAFPAAMASHNATYLVEQIDPGASLQREDGVLFSQPVALREINDGVSAWAASDTPEVYEPVVDELAYDLDPPLALDLTTESVREGVSITANVTPAVAHRVQGVIYAIEYRETGADDWIGGDMIRPTWVGGEPGDPYRATGVIPRLEGETEYEVQVRAEGAGRRSAWVGPEDITTEAAVTGALWSGEGW